MKYKDAGCVPQLHIDALIALKLLFDVLEVEVEGLGLAHLCGGGELLGEGEELVVVAAVVEELCVGLGRGVWGVYLNKESTHRCSRQTRP